ncbi:hypothetical protein BBJ28_00019217 [Nothophytophthora sp. Chile5]|nr:hypothetical protein BBJ28_00019217 [Nothophytophthora sp. Chile5]
MLLCLLLFTPHSSRSPPSLKPAVSINMRGNRRQPAAAEPEEDADELAGQPTDECGIPLSVRHSPQTGLPVWQFIHMLETPLTNPHKAGRPFTHVCVLCAADPPLRGLNKTPPTWRKALMRQRMSTNAVSHMQRVHPEEFVAIADFKQRKREKLLAGASATEDGEPKKKKAKKAAPKTAKKRAKAVQNDQEAGELETKVESASPAAAVAVVKPRGNAAMRQRVAAQNAEQRKVLMSRWLLSAGTSNQSSSSLPLSTLENATLQQLLDPSSTSLRLPTLPNLHDQVHEEFRQFTLLLETFLRAETQSALNLPFLSLRYELRPLPQSTADHGDDGRVQQRAFLGASIGFIDSHWRHVDLALLAQHVPMPWDNQTSDLVARVLSETYAIHEIPQYARFRVAANGVLAPETTGGRETDADEQEDLLTRTLRRCVVNALDLKSPGALGRESTCRRLVRLFQELLEFFHGPMRNNLLHHLGETHGVPVEWSPSSTIDELVQSSATSIGGVAELLRVSCTNYRAFCLYFQSPGRPTENEPELESVWTQLSLDDWRTATEMEALLYQLDQFSLEQRAAPRTGAVAPSYALLFRRLLSVTTKATSFKCLTLDDDSAVFASPNKRLARRKAKWVENFTGAGQECLTRLRQEITTHFAAPSTPSAVDDEIKAMLLDPRISSKAASLVTDVRAFRRAQDALRQEHRVIFEELATREAAANVVDEGEVEYVEEEEEDDEMSALLMVDGPKQNPARSRRTSTSKSSKLSANALAEDEARAWREWQQVFVAWDMLAEEGADLFAKGGQYNLLKLYHHVNILQWFRDVGQQAHPAAALLARFYLGQQPPPSQALSTSLSRFLGQEEASWGLEAAHRAEKRCVLHHNWRQCQRLSETLPATNAEASGTGVV